MSRPAPRGPLVLLLPAVLAALGLLGRGLAERAWRAFTTYQTPFTFQNPGALTPPPLVEQVVVVLVDGLAYHASRAMPFLNELRRRGADADCRVGLPSLSLPGRAVLMTGAWQETHGQLTNFNPRPLPVEHLFQTARRRGLRTALAAGSGPQTLFGLWIEERLVYARLQPADVRDLAKLEAELRWMGEATRALLREKKPNLFLLDFTIADEAGHAWGAASREYEAAAAAVDEEILRMAAELDLRRSVLVVTADHGHTATGGHGGPEEPVIHVPLVLAGGPLRPGSTAQAEQVDVAPTVAALLGIEVPASSQGRPLLELLDITPESRRAILDSVRQQKESFASQYLTWISGRPPASANLALLEQEAARARDERLQREERSRRGSLAALVVLPLAVLAGLWILRVFTVSELSAGVLAALGATLLYHALFPLVGLDYSFSAVNREESLGSFFAKDMALAAGAGAAAIAAMAAWMERRRRAPLSALARVAWLAAIVFGYLFLVRIAFVDWRHGIFMRWHMPEQHWGFRFYLDALALTAVGFAGVGFPLIAWLAARLVRLRSN